MRSQASTIMHRLNPNALIGLENGTEIMIEDWSDPDGRIYRMEYQSTPDGLHAIAFCRFNPWGEQGNVTAGVSALQGHVFSDGSICMGSGHSGSVRSSRYTLETVLQRGRFWCTAFSVFKESGRFPNP